MRDIETENKTHVVIFKIAGKVLFDSSKVTPAASKPIMDVLKGQDEDDEYYSDDSDNAAMVNIVSVECEVHYPRK